jgi:Mg-chelatase subunit ChlD
VTETKTATVTETPSIKTETTAMARTQAALDSLKKSASKNSLDDLVKGRRRSLLLVDVSDSMSARIRTGGRRIDALRKVVEGLRQTHRVPVAAFPGRGEPVVVVETIPEPRGNTPLADAIEFGTREGATHLVVVTDGEPNSEESAFEAAAQFGHPIDVFFIGDSKGYGQQAGMHFAQELARRTGGVFNLTDLEAPKELASKIVGLLGDGSAR